jgi:S1-C subfamily serine protease
MAPALILGAEEGPICPICGASAEPDAAFCTQCGHRLEPTKTPPADRPGKPDPSASVVQVVAAHDKEMTSAHRAIAYGTKVHVDSMLGTGFSIAPGRIVTDSGVLAGAREINLFSASHRKIPARVVGVDHLIGVALLATDAVDIPPLATRSGEPAQLGERLRVFGFPSTPGTASGLLATSGVISGLNRTEIGIHPIEDYQQTDATLASGFAGGPVVDAEGRLIGMSTSLPLGRRLLLGPVGIALSIPLAWIERALDWIQSGQPPRPWIGMLVHRATPDLLAEYRLPAEVRSMVDQIFPDSPAGNAGLRRGDGLLRVQGVDGHDITAIQERLLSAKPGDTWQIDLLRAGERQTLTITLASRPERPRLSALDALRHYGGVEISPHGRRLEVTRVLPRTVAARSKIRPGDVLRSVLIKKDLQHAHRANARWRSVRNVEKLEELLEYSYSETDFFVGLRFNPSDGPKRMMYLLEFLVGTDAL